MATLTSTPATYKYRQPDFNGGYTEGRARVLVIGETLRSYRVRYLDCGPRGIPPGYETFVSKRSVLLPDQQIRRTPQEVAARLPYKD